MFMTKRSTDTEPFVFIVEALEFEDERRGRLEGRILRQILRLSEKQTKYVYLRTAKELRAVLAHFKNSKMRYLHLSCHGDSKSVALTLDTLTFEDFADCARPFLAGRRLFLSACSVANHHLARVLIPGSGCQSLVGPATDITFADAALMWASFYHLVFKENPKAMGMEAILSSLRKTRRTFGVKFRYFSASRGSDLGYKERLIGAA